MKSKFILIIPFLLTFFCADAQMMFVAPDHIEDELYTSASHFNYNFIKRNRIIEIKGSVLFKEEMKPIKETGLEVSYSFDNEGRPKRYFKTYKVFTNPIDTNLVFYHFNDEGRCDLIRRSEGQGFFTHNYQYDVENRVISYEYVSEKNKNNLKTNFELFKKLSIFSERYEYIGSDTLNTQRLVINDIGKKYKKEEWRYNEGGDLVEKGYKYIMTNKGERKSYEYDFQGRISKTEISNNLGRLKNTRIEFEYDNIGNLIKEITFKNDVLISTKEFLYNDILLLDAQLTKNEKSGSIEIVKFTYEFLE